MPNLVGLAVIIGFIVALVWSLRTLARIQRDQAVLFAEAEVQNAAPRVEGL